MSMTVSKRICALLSLIAALCLLSGHVLAAGIIDLNRDTGLTLTYQTQGTPLSGAEFRIYLVAAADQYGELTATEDFSGYHVDFQGKNDEAWQKLAATLEGYVLRDSLAPADSGKTDPQGHLSFPTGGSKLTPGLYLVLGQRHTQNGTYYDPAPFLVLLPCQDLDSNSWNYRVDADVKFDASQIPDDSSPGTVNRKVLKVWKDDGEDRPGSVTVQLLRNGTVYDTVTLSEENNWRHIWTGLNSNDTWRVVEKTVPDGYHVTMSRDGITFVVTNTADTPTPPETPVLPGSPDTPDQPDKPDQPNKPGQPDKSDQSGGPEQPDTPQRPTLPQTGQLWWPVPMLAAAGLLLIAAGLLRRKAGNYEA